jgi:hypothetical protein
MDTNAAVTEGGESKAYSADDLRKAELTALSVPVRNDLPEIATLVAGFRQNMVGGELDGKELSVDVGAGLGTDWVILRYGDKTGVMRGTEILRAWIASFDPDAAAAMEGVRACPAAS